MSDFSKFDGRLVVVEVTWLDDPMDPTSARSREVTGLAQLDEDGKLHVPLGQGQVLVITKESLPLVRLAE